MKYLANVRSENAEAVIQQLCVGFPGRAVVVGPPLESSVATTQRLQSMGVVGLYEEHAGELPNDEAG